MNLYKEIIMQIQCQSENDAGHYSLPNLATKTNMVSSKVNYRKWFCNKRDS